MAIGLRREVPSDVTRTTICVDRLSNGEIYGRCYNPYHGAPPRFVGLAALIDRMERLFDGFSFPQRTLEPRRFRVGARRRVILKGQKEAKGVPKEMKTQGEQRGERATFVVSVQFRQNATWQGTVSWSEQKKTLHFRSMLELISLMNDALVEDDSLIKWETTDSSGGDENK